MSRWRASLWRASLTFNSIPFIEPTALITDVVPMLLSRTKIKLVLLPYRHKEPLGLCMTIMRKDQYLTTFFMSGK